MIWFGLVWFLGFHLSNQSIREKVFYPVYLMNYRVNDQINTKSALLILFLVFVSAGLVCQNLSTSLQQQQKDDFFLSFFLLLHWLHFGWVIMPPMKWFKWQSSWQSEVLIQIHLLLLLGKFQSSLAEWVYKSTCCCCCWVNSWVPWQSFQLLLHLLQVLLGWWIPEFFAEFPTPPLVASVAEWIANAAQVFEIMNFWCSKSGQHPFIYSKM